MNNPDAPQESVPTKVWHFLVQSIRFVRDAYLQLKPCALGIAMAVLAFLVFVQFDQGAEVLRALAERRVNEQGMYSTGATSMFRLIAFFVGTLLWCWASWYTSRVLLYVNLPTTAQLYAKNQQNWPSAQLWLARNVPRILGAAPLAIIGYSMLHAAGTYEIDPPIWLYVFGILSLIASAAMWFLLHKRRQSLEEKAKDEHESIIEKLPEGEGSKDSASLGEVRLMALNPTLLKGVPEQKRNYLRSLRVLPIHEMKSAHRVLLFGGIASVILFLLFTINPIRFAGGIGTGAVLTLAGASWILWGSALVYWGARARLPLLTLVLIFAVVSSIWNDNHNVRVLKSAEGNPRPDLETALSNWHARVVQKYGDQKPHPLFIVTAEGGGIRAAYWTAAVLGTIQDRNCTFADHIFAISGVSGGSVGAAVFAALLAEGDAQGQYAQRAEEMLGQDFLSPAIAAMLYPDSLQRFCPIPFTALDRGHWMEQSWEQAWAQTASKHGHKNNQFAENFSSLWQDGKPYVPVLLLNATSVEKGNRVIVSNIQIQQERFLAADDLMNKIGSGNDVALSTAAHLSARFTYVSPAARFPADNTHAVDGGYFENSGATTAIDILREISLLQQSPDQSKRDIVANIVPKIIMIANNPVGDSFWEEQCEPGKPGKANVTVARELSHRKPSSLLEDELAPIYALLNTRDARGIYAQRAIGYANNGFSSDPKKQVYFFSLAKTTVPLPLGWMLSNRAADAIQLELFDQKATKGGAPERIRECHVGQELTWNSEERDLIVESLDACNDNASQRSTTAR